MFSFFFRGEGKCVGEIWNDNVKRYWGTNPTTKKTPKPSKAQKGYIRHSSEWWNGGSVWCISQRSRPFQASNAWFSNWRTTPWMLLMSACCEMNAAYIRYRKYWKKDAIRKEFFSTSSWKNATFLKATLPTMYRVPYLRKEWGSGKKPLAAAKQKTWEISKIQRNLRKKTYILDSSGSWGASPRLPQNCFCWFYCFFCFLEVLLFFCFLGFICF